MFSINFSNNEVKSNNISDDVEFVFKEDEIEIFEYLSNILPNLNFSNLKAVDLESVKNKIQLDHSVKSEIKENIFRFLDTARNNNQNIFIKFHEHYNLKESDNDVINSPFNSKIKKESLKGSTPVIKSLEQSIDKSDEKSLEANNFKKNNDGIIKFEKKNKWSSNINLW